MAVQETRQKSSFSSRKFGLYQPALTALEHASILSPSIRSPHGSANGYASMETYLLFALYLLLDIGSFPFLYLLLSMKSLEPFGTPIALELRASFFAPREASTPVYFSFFFLFVFVMFVYQAKIIQNCFYHKPQKNSTTALTPPASNHYSIFADPPLINHTNYCPLFPPALGSAPFPFLFPFLPQIRTLRQVANKLHGYIYSALATYFYAVIYLHHEDIDGHLLRLYNF